MPKPHAFVTLYCTAMVTVLLGTPSMMICNSCVPEGTPAGTCTFTWYNPTNVGAAPEKLTVAGIPAMFTCGGLTVCGGGIGGGSPDGTGLCNRPRPVQKMARNSPVWAGSLSVTNWKESA